MAPGRDTAPGFLLPEAITMSDGVSAKRCEQWASAGRNLFAAALLFSCY
jgi:hypothetical protein